MLLETFVAPRRFYGAVYKAADWTCVGTSKGYRRVPKGCHNAKMVFVKPLQQNARSHRVIFWLSLPLSGHTRPRISYRSLEAQPESRPDALPARFLLCNPWS
ncbi:MAG TPA: hypothetical protein DCZ04_03770 [Syntrophorhabdus aromaticivorans]|nr:hypothetical protein [Syntrophorhabdus aromaticivorans]